MGRKTRLRSIRQLSPLELRHIRQLIGSGLSQAKVSWETGVSLSSVRHLVVKLGGVKRIRERTRQGVC